MVYEIWYNRIINNKERRNKMSEKMSKEKELLKEILKTEVLDYEIIRLSELVKEEKTYSGTSIHEMHLRSEIKMYQKIIRDTKKVINEESEVA